MALNEMDINKNKPWTLNQVYQEKPAIPRTEEMLSGFIGNSFNAGHNRTIAWKKVMAGEKHLEYRMKAKIKLLTPLTPPYQQLKMTVRAYFVPNIRVWENAEKYAAQKGGSAEIKIKEIPNLGGQVIPRMPDDGANPYNYTSLMNTDLWRDSFMSCYIPRMGEMVTAQDNEPVEKTEYTLPKISVLPLRGRIAIYNDWERNKEYDREITEYKGDTVSEIEFNNYLVDTGYANQNDLDHYQMRARRPNSYYSSYRTEMQGFETDMPDNETMPRNESLITWAAWESKIAEARSEAENTNALPWQIIAKIRGSKTAEQGKVQLIGENTINLNYAAVTQNAYNANENVNEQFQVLGQQGAYSYTEVDMPVYAGYEAIEEGYIHIIATVWADSVFTSGIDRNLLNVTPLDEYRPDLKDDKYDVLYEMEAGTKKINTDAYKIIGFKRKYNEYFKLPNCIAGDLTNEDYFQTDWENGIYKRDQIILAQSSYQFFEDDRFYYQQQNRTYPKKPWKDYSDMLVNKNQAIMNTVNVETIESNSIWLGGQNQIDIVAKAYLRCILPIDGSIKNNFTDWGEH